MLKNKEGQKAPNLTLLTRKQGEWAKVNTGDLFSGKKIALFALPGAFTPTCSSTHLPRYNELAGVFKENGVDKIVCLSVNDAFVMEAWEKDQKADNILFLSDGNGEFSEAMGMLVDKSNIGFGKRSWRYSMLVNDGVIEKMFIEPEVEGDPFEVSDADTMLKYINPNAKLPAEVTILSKPGCPFCANAKALLTEKGYSYEDISMGSGISFKSVRNLTKQSIVPQIFINGEHIAGFDKLQEYLAK